MEKLLKSLNTRISYIRNNSTNKFILTTLDIIDISVNDIKERIFDTEDSLNQCIDHIINYHISRMKRVPGENNMVYKKMDEMAGFLNDIRTTYFEEN